MIYSLATIWYERNRYLPGVVAVTFSALIIFVPTGVLLGLFSQTSTPIDRSAADLWVGHPRVKSVDLGRPFPERWLARVAEQPEVERAEEYMLSMAMLHKRDGGTETCAVIGTRLDDDSLGLPPACRLTPGLGRALGEAGAFAADESELHRLGLDKVGDEGEVNGHRMRLVGLVRGYKSLATPYLVCSMETAKMLLPAIPRDRTMFLLAKCKDPADAPQVVERLRAAYKDEMGAFTKAAFSAQTRRHWLNTAQVAKATLATAVLGGIVGIAITGLILYSATAASQREYAVLQALGIPRWRMAAAVLAQSGWVGGLGVMLALPVTFGVASLAAVRGLRMDLPPPLLGAGAVLTVVIALLSGLFGLWALRLVEPPKLLR
jgi:putative ABC transport system permease protein